MTPPVFNKIGCPKPETWPFKGENNCFVGSTACIRDWGYIKDNPKPLVDIGDLRRNNNVYRIIRARSWWFCGELDLSKAKALAYQTRRSILGSVCSTK